MNLFLLCRQSGTGVLKNDYDESMNVDQGLRLAVKVMFLTFAPSALGVHFVSSDTLV